MTAPNIIPNPLLPMAGTTHSSVETPKVRSEHWLTLAVRNIMAQFTFTTVLYVWQLAHHNRMATVATFVAETAACETAPSKDSSAPFTSKMAQIIPSISIWKSS